MGIIPTPFAPFRPDIVKTLPEGQSTFDDARVTLMVLTDNGDID